MGNVFSFGWEDSLILFIQRFMSEFMVKLAGIITEFGDATILVLVMGLFYWSLNKDLGKKLIVYLGCVNIVNPFVKAVFKRYRPYMANKEIKCLKPVNSDGDIYDIVTQDYSFPSGHSDNSMAIYGSIAKSHKNVVLRILMGVLILLVGCSRFALGVHYPTDVLAGFALAIIVVALYDFLEKKLGRYKTYLLLDVIGIFGFLIAKTNEFYTGYGMLLGSTIGIIFEEKYVNFEGTKKWFLVIIRTVVGAGLYLAINAILKMPFPEEFLASGTTLAFAVRTLRYAVIGFLLLGVYPMSFKWFKKQEKK